MKVGEWWIPTSELTNLVYKKTGNIITPSKVLVSKISKDSIEITWKRLVIKISKASALGFLSRRLTKKESERSKRKKVTAGIPGGTARMYPKSPCGNH